MQLSTAVLTRRTCGDMPIRLCGNTHLPADAGNVGGHTKDSSRVVGAFLKLSGRTGERSEAVGETAGASPSGDLSGLRL